MAKVYDKKLYSEIIEKVISNKLTQKRLLKIKHN